MTAAARRHDQPEPNTLPRGIGLLNLAFFCLLLSDLGTAGALLAQLSVADDEARTLGPALGILLSFVYFIFPLQFLNGRATVAVAAYRILLWLLLVLHLPLLLLAALDWMRQPDAAALLVLTAPMSLLASIGLVPVARALKSLRWLDLAAPPQEWEPLAGDAVPGTDQPRGLPTPMLVALPLPFIAAFRARQMALAALSLVLWCGGLVLSGGGAAARGGAAGHRRRHRPPRGAGGAGKRLPSAGRLACTASSRPSGCGRRRAGSPPGCSACPCWRCWIMPPPRRCGWRAARPGCRHSSTRWSRGFSPSSSSSRWCSCR